MSPNILYLSNMEPQMGYAAVYIWAIDLKKATKMAGSSFTKCFRKNPVQKFKRLPFNLLTSHFFQMDPLVAFNCPNSFKLQSSNNQLDIHLGIHIHIPSQLTFESMMFYRFFAGGTVPPWFLDQPILKQKTG